MHDCVRKLYNMKQGSAAIAVMFSPVTWKYMAKDYEAQISHFRVAYFLCFKTSPGTQPLIWKRVLPACPDCLANQTHFYLKGCAPGLVLEQRQKATRNDLLIH